MAGPLPDWQYIVHNGGTFTDFVLEYDLNYSSGATVRTTQQFLSEDERAQFIAKAKWLEPQFAAGTVRFGTHTVTHSPTTWEEGPAQLPPPRLPQITDDDPIIEEF